MKHKLFAIAMAVFISHACFSQDVITYKNGTEAKVKVMEVTSTEVKFKKEENPDGPVYAELKSKIFMILYANGNKEVFGDNVAKPVSTATTTGGKQQTFNDDRLKFSGPRIGFTIIGNGWVADKLRERNKTPFITQCGWQFETRIFTLSDGATGVFEFVPLIGGMEQGMFLPSVSALMGIRGKKGAEFAFGPNLSLIGAGMVIAVGSSFHSENVYFPVNLVLIPSVGRIEAGVKERTGVRVSLLIGFMTRKR